MHELAWHCSRQALQVENDGCVTIHALQHMQGRQRARERHCQPGLVSHNKGEVEEGCRRCHSLSQHLTFSYQAACGKRRTKHQ